MSSAGRVAQAEISKGRFAPAEYLLELVAKRMADDDCRKGYVLDGFPRTLDQMERMDAMGIRPRLSMVIIVPDDVVVNRLSGRLVHSPSGRAYHATDKPPRNAGMDDATGEPLTRRPDDEPGTVIARLDAYHRQTAPMVAVMSELAAAGDAGYTVVNGVGAFTIVAKRVGDALDAAGIRPNRTTRRRDTGLTR